MSRRSQNVQYGNLKTARVLDLAPLLKLAPVRLVDLQYGDTTAEREQFSAETGNAFIHFDEIDNTNDLSALSALMRLATSL